MAQDQQSSIVVAITFYYMYKIYLKIVFPTYHALKRGGIRKMTRV